MKKQEETQLRGEEKTNEQAHAVAVMVQDRPNDGRNNASGLQSE
jgi:hypothetical protein